jgi:hypothetical protein
MLTIISMTVAYKQIIQIGCVFKMLHYIIIGMIDEDVSKYKRRMLILIVVVIIVETIDNLKLTILGYF